MHLGKEVASGTWRVGPLTGNAGLPLNIGRNNWGRAVSRGENKNSLVAKGGLPRPRFDLTGAIKVGSKRWGVIGAEGKMLPPLPPQNLEPWRPGLAR